MWKWSSNKPPELKTRREIGLMREAGKLVARAHRICRDLAKPGARTRDLNDAVEAFYAQHGAIPLFKGYPGKRVPFPAATCISINDEIVHGIPGERRIREGDLLKIDTACKLNGWCADAAVTLVMGQVRPEWHRMVRVTEEVLRIAILELGRKRWWSEVARQMEQHVKNAGFSVVEQYVGHGIGRIMHENPQVPNYVAHELRKHDFRLEEGLVLAVEPMVNMGGSETVEMPDHWTVRSKDKMPSAHVEHTLAITSEGIMIVTADEEPGEGALVSVGSAAAAAPVPVPAG